MTMRNGDTQYEHDPYDGIDQSILDEIDAQGAFEPEGFFLSSRGLERLIRDLELEGEPFGSDDDDEDLF